MDLLCLVLGWCERGLTLTLSQFSNCCLLGRTGKMVKKVCPCNQLCSNYLSFWSFLLPFIHPSPPSLHLLAHNPAAHPVLCGYRLWYPAPFRLRSIHFFQPGKWSETLMIYSPLIKIRIWNDWIDLWPQAQTESACLYSSEQLSNLLFSLLSSYILASALKYISQSPMLLQSVMTQRLQPHIYFPPFYFTWCDRFFFCHATGLAVFCQWECTHILFVVLNLCSKK